MRWCVFITLLCLLLVAVEQTKAADLDTLATRVVQLPEVTITSSPVERQVPVSSIAVSPVAIRTNSRD